jgi:hypothetical protein
MEEYNMEFKSQSEVEAIRKQYPVGSWIQIDHMDDPQAPAQGTIGKVINVDDIGNIHITGTGLSLIPGVDRFHKLLQFRVNRVEDKITGRVLLVLVDTIKTGFPQVFQYEDDGKSNIWIYDLCDYLNNKIGGANV